MSKNYEQQLLDLIPTTRAFTPDTVPMGQIIAHSTTAPSYAIEKAMVYLALQVPFDIDGATWPSFHSNEEGRYRVQGRMGTIDLLLIERGMGRHGYRGLRFVDAFYQVLRLLLPTYSVDAANTLLALDKTGGNRMLKTWLAQASMVRHMVEINGTFGRRAAGNCLSWMCEQLVKMEAYATMAEAVAAEETLVHALRLGGLPEKWARTIYREFMPEQRAKVSKAVPLNAIIVSIAAFDSADPAAIVQSNIDFVTAQIEAGVTQDELSAEALRSYYVDYFYRQFNEGGWAQFVYNISWDQSLISKVNDGLRAVGASWHQQLFSRAAKALKGFRRDKKQRFLTSSYLDGGDRIAQKIGALLNRYNDHFLAEEKLKSLLNYNANWLRKHPKLVVLSDKDIVTELRKRIEALPRANYQNDSPTHRRKKQLMQALSKAAGHEFGSIGIRFRSDGAEQASKKAQRDDAWRFTTNKGAYDLVDSGDRAKMFDAVSGELICEVDASYARFNPIAAIEKNMIPHLVELIATDDFSGIESARFDVERHHIEFLIGHYETLESWGQKRALIDLVHAQGDETLRPIMLDFLRAPAGQYEAMDHSRAAALCLINDQHDRLDAYTCNRTLLETDIATALREHGLTPSQK